MLRLYRGAERAPSAGRVNAAEQAINRTCPPRQMFVLGKKLVQKITQEEQQLPHILRDVPGQSGSSQLFVGFTTSPLCCRGSGGCRRWSSGTTRCGWAQQRGVMSVQVSADMQWSPQHHGKSGHDVPRAEELPRACSSLPPGSAGTSR